MSYYTGTLVDGWGYTLRPPWAGAKPLLGRPPAQ